MTDEPTRTGESAAVDKTECGFCDDGLVVFGGVEQSCPYCGGHAHQEDPR